MWQDGHQSRVGLHDLIEHSSEIVDLVLAPHERISVMRLLICIVQRAINGPVTIEDREDCKDEIVPKTLKYLDAWQHAFELVGENGAFLQFASVQPDKEGQYTPLSKLNMTKASGNNPTLFDNGEYGENAVDLGLLALNLLTYQNFSVGGTIGIARWNGELTAPKAPDSASAAPCVCASAIHLFLKTPTMLETIALNLIPFESMCPALQSVGVPVWEKMPTSAADVDAIKNASLTYLGRLVPVSRCVKIMSDLSGCINAKGVEYPSWIDNQLVYYEPSMTLFKTPKEQRNVAVGANPDKSLWRSLPSLLHRYRKSYMLPAVFDNETIPDQFDIWIGAMIVDKAKIVDIIEDSYVHLSPNAADSPAFEVMIDLVKKAELAAWQLKEAMKKYLAGLTDSVKNAPDLHMHAERDYWLELARYKELLIELVRKSTNAESLDSVKSISEQWLQHVVCCARVSFESVAMKNTPRQLRAWSAARQYLPSIKTLTYEKP